MEIILCSNDKYDKTTRSRETIKYIVVHYTAGDGDTARANCKYFQRAGGRKASAHYFVDQKEILCSVPWFNVAWHCGGDKYANTKGGAFHGKCKNYNSLGVEMCSVVKNGVYQIPEATQKRAAAFVAQLMDQYKVPTERVIRHYDVTGKQCPAPMVEQKKWDEFKKLVLKSGGENVAAEKIMYYEKFAEIPQTHRPTIEKLIREGYLKGKPDGLHLSEDMLRTFTILDRAGVFDK